MYSLWPPSGWLSVCAHWLRAKSCSQGCCQKCAQEAGHGGCWGWGGTPSEHWGWAVKGVCERGILSSSCTGFLMESTAQYDPNPFSALREFHLALSQPLPLCSPDVHYSVFWMDWERTELLLQCSTQLGSWVLSHMLSFFLIGEITGSEDPPWP